MRVYKLMIVLAVCLAGCKAIKKTSNTNSQYTQQSKVSSTAQTNETEISVQVHEFEDEQRGETTVVKVTAPDSTFSFTPSEGFKGAAASIEITTTKTKQIKKEVKQQAKETTQNEQVTATRQDTSGIVTSTEKEVTKEPKPPSFKLMMGIVLSWVCFMIAGLMLYKKYVLRR